MSTLRPRSALAGGFRRIRSKLRVESGGVVPLPDAHPSRVAPGAAENLVAHRALRLLCPSQDVSLDAIADGLIDSPDLDLRTLRRVLNALDSEVAPSPVTVRFGPDDIVRHEGPDGMVLYLDQDDMAVSRPILDGHDYEPHLAAVFRRYCAPGMTVVDVGANIGYFTMLAARLVGPSGRVVAVEPNSENCRLLLLSVDANKAHNVELFPLALGRDRGWSHFSTAIGSNGHLRSGGSSELLDGRGFVVPTFPLDDLIDGPVDFIKLDVEGAEGLAVAGARRLIQKWRPVVTTEFSIEMLGRVSSVSGAEYFGWFENLGYTISVLSRETGAPGPAVTSQELLAAWPGHLDIGDILLVPTATHRSASASAQTSLPIPRAAPGH